MSAEVMSSKNPILLDCKNLRISVPGRLLVDELELSLHRGEFVAVLGQNGAGKSLTLTTLAGLRSPARGQVFLQGEDVFARDRLRTAQQLALLPQVIDDIFPATVIDTALIGRHPHIGRLRWESATDFAIANEALRTMELEDLATRDVLTLSGGERRRLAIAQVLTQAPEIYLLDEPTNHLDPQHQLDTLRVFRQAADEGAGIIASVHDANMAVRFADRCLLLYGDGNWEIGRSEDVLTESKLSDLFATPMEAVSWRNHKLFVATSGHPTP
jgi:iron complex transport system ATP-binding protein